MSHSQKISSFNVSTSLNNSDLFTFVLNGTNKNISFSDFKLALGVTGTLNQVGDPLGAPILDKTSATQNNIRSLESTKGVIASVSAQNGVALACNFKQSASGSKLITDLNSKQYEFKTLIGGESINITDTGESLRIDFATDVTSTKTVVISQLSDFPEPVNGVITLLSDVDYLLVQDITTSNRFVVGNPTTVRSSSTQMVSLTYTGTGDMFTGSDPSLKIMHITVSCPNGTLFNVSSAGGGIVQMIESNIGSCENIGTIDGNFITRFTNVAFQDIKTNGLILAGVNNTLVVDTIIVFLNGGTLFDFSSSTFQAVSISGVIVTVSSEGTTYISGLSSSGNIVSGGLGTVFDSKLFGSLSSLSGISPEDSRWNFSLNNTIADTRPDSLLSFQTPTTTVLAAATPALITGTWTVERTSQMTGTIGGRTTYNGEKNAILPITAALSLEPVSGTNKDVNIYLAKNGSVIANSKVSTTVSSGSPKNQSVVWQDNWASGDFYEVWIESLDGTDLQVNSAKLRVN